MGYQVIDPGSLEPMGDRPVDARSISDAAGLKNMGVRLYHVEPGEQLPLTYHYHETQEEIFHVLDGRLTVETPDQVFRVEAGEVFVADPESPHRAHNPASADAPVRVFAVGAPAASDAVEYRPD